MAKSRSTDKVAGISSATVQAKTGKTWAEWIKILDAAGAKKMSHPEIVALLGEQHGVGDWWQQMVTVGYEQYKGLRAKHQKPEGFQVSGSKTVNVPVAALYRAWSDEAARARWLKRRKLVIRTARPGKSIRAAWSDGKTSIDANFYAKGDSKSQVSVQHSKLPSAGEAAKMKAFWAKALQNLKELLESNRVLP